MTVLGDFRVCRMAWLASSHTIPAESRRVPLQVPMIVLVLIEVCVCTSYFGSYGDWQLRSFVV